MRVSIRSILLSAEKISLPIPNPTGRVSPGVRNFNHDSIKLIAHIKPHQVNISAMAMDAAVDILEQWGCGTVFVIVYFGKE